MSQSPNPNNLSVRQGSISTAFRVYRNHLISYSWLSLFAGLWLFVPVYGWAKHCAIAGAISRQTFQGLVNQPESIAVAKSRTNSLIWHWLATGIALTWIRFKLAALTLVISLLAWLATMLIASIFFHGYITAKENTAIALILTSFPPLVFLIIALTRILRLYSRVWLAEAFLAIGSLNTTDGVSQRWESNISKSWRSTRGAAKRISLKVWVVLIMLVIATGMAIIPVHAGLGFVHKLGQLPNVVYSKRQLIEQNSAQMTQTLMLSYAMAQILLMPFAQVLKAVVYFDIQGQREF
ncbi:MAG: hypothetical protein KME15_23960 [Drouetiella hepatica Uher 2000/2452]|jgi:hypothetical protein|uniref:Uncharacterized protein n=1 Tax=Drouetiella hepatica Uher 2000/2452 TaxID=904376 RepID=A0A951QEG5_9CYAN|nr:hypothetical protein [Drouetiella hepatica Uher 2000/2452]